MAQPFNVWQPAPLLHYQPVLDDHGNTIRLGEGGFAAVFLYRNSDTGERVAIKRVRLTNLPLKKAKLVIKYMPSELQNHYVLNHPHVIKLKDVFVAGNYLNIVLELARDGMLHEYVNEILRTNGVMREDHARWFLQQLVLTMEYFHRRNIAHRDIKLENTLLQVVPGLPLPLIKVADFGLSKHNASLTFTRIGTEAYMSPEVLKGLHPEGGGIGLAYNAEKADIWSAGVMLYAMLVGRYPFEGDVPDGNLPEHVRLQLMTQRPLRDLPPGLTSECREFLEGTLHPNEDERMTVEQIKQHPWFLRHLPPTSLNMTDSYIHRGPVCQRTPAELCVIIAEALQILGTGSPELQQLAAEAMQQLGAVEPAGAAAAPAGAAMGAAAPAGAAV